MINYLIFAISYAFACVVQPGPFQAFLFSQSITHGWKKTFPLVFAPFFSDIPVILLVLLLLSNIPHEALSLLQVAGGIFLLYLAHNAFKTWRTFSPELPNSEASDYNFVKAILVNLLNPNPYLAWSLVMGPWLLKAWSENHVNGIVLIAGFYGSMFMYSTVMIWLFASARNLGPRISRAALGISVIAFAVFGLYQLWSGLSDMV